MELAFWSCLALAAWAYVGYPACLAVLARARRRTLRHAAIEPTVTVIVCAHNEEKDIGAKLDATLALDYPPSRLEVIVASDCSTDRTHEIVRGFESRGVRLVALPERRGKTAAQNAAVREARGEVLVFTDATTRFRPGMVRTLVAPLADPRVGCVGAELEYVSEAGSLVGKGGGLYWRYEKKVKELESEVNSLIGVSGCLYATRAALYRPIEADLISDFTIVLDTFAQGYVTAYARGTVSVEKTNEDTGREFEMRTRVVIRTIHALVRRARMLNPLRYGLFAFQLWSHKVARYLVPELLAGALVASLVLAARSWPRAPLFQALATLQVAGYLGAAALWWASRQFGLRATVLSAPIYFVQVNAAATWGLLSYLRGERKITWTTAR